MGNPDCTGPGSCTLRRATRRFEIGGVAVGGGAPVSVQSMTNVATTEVDAVVDQVRRLAAVGCELVRVAVPDAESVEALGRILHESPLPVIADIHFDYRLAIAAVEAGVAAIRINPGNLGGDDRLAAVAAALRTSGTPVRVGVNGGSLEKRLLTAHGGPTPDALAASAREQCAKLEAMGVTRIKVSIKSSDVLTTVQACRLFAAGTDYPLHLGVTEAGTPLRGVVKSAVGIGALLIDGIGDTIRVSLTADPVEEVKAALRILEAVGLRNPAPEVVSCPTCGRTRIDLEGLVHEVEAEIDRLKAAGFQLPVRKVAIMGCVVNGPGEARDADLGVAGGDGFGVLFRAGRVVERVPEEELGPRLVHELQRLAVRPDDHDPCPADGNAGARRGD